MHENPWKCICCVVAECGNVVAVVCLVVAWRKNELMQPRILVVVIMDSMT